MTKKKKKIGKRALAALAVKEEEVDETMLIDGETVDSYEESLGDLTSGNFQGFNQYGIEWDKQGTNFQVNTDEGVRFYGWWRKTRNRGSDAIVYAIDVFASRIVKEQERDFTVDSITYVKDPRNNMRSLNNDICAVMNRWFHVNLNDNAKHLDQILKQAEHPVIYMSRIGSIDALILKLREFRDTAITCGGERLFELTGDREHGPTIHVVVNFTSQSIALESKPPRLGYGVISDHAIATKGKRDAPRARVSANIPASGNVADIVAQLKKTTDPAQQRKLRAILRRMGHRGGARRAE